LQACDETGTLSEIKDDLAAGPPRPAALKTILNFCSESKKRGEACAPDAVCGLKMSIESSLNG